MLRPDEAIAALERGLVLLADDDPSPERAGLLSRQARMLMLQSRYHRAVGVARRALAEQAELDADDAEHIDEAGALNALGVSLAATGEIEEGVAALQRALDLANEIGRLQDVAVAASNLSETLHFVGRTDEALAVAHTAYGQVGALPTRQRWLALAIAQYSFDAGDWETAEGSLAGMTRRRYSGGNSELNSRLIHAELSLGRDERDVARRELERARPSSPSTPASRSTWACSARCRPSSRRGTATRRARAPRSTRRWTGSSSAPTTRCGWRWRRPPG